MQITEQTTITEAAAAVPASVRVFRRYGIDVCCDGRRPIANACEEHGISFDSLVSAIEAAQAASDDDSNDWSRESLSALTRHIVRAYHEPLREELPRLESMAFRAARTHEAASPLLASIEALVGDLSSDLRLTCAKRRSFCHVNASRVVMSRSPEDCWSACSVGTSSWVLNSVVRYVATCDRMAGVSPGSGAVRAGA